MLTLTYGTIAAMHTCWLDEPGGEQRLREACDRLGGTFTIVGVLQAEWIEPDERVWVATRKGVLSDSTLRMFAARTARRALERERAAGREPDARLWAAVETAEKQARGEATEGSVGLAWANAGAAVAESWAMARREGDPEWARSAKWAAVTAEAAVAPTAEWAAQAAASAAVYDKSLSEGKAECHAQVADLLELLADQQTDVSAKEPTPVEPTP